MFALGRPVVLRAILAAARLCRAAWSDLATGTASLVFGLAASMAWMPGRAAAGGAAVLLALAGASLAAAWGPPLVRAALLAALGVAAGWSAQLALASSAEAIGSAAVVLVLHAAVAALARVGGSRLPAPAAALAVRVAGSWIAAVGVLLAALWATGRAA